jgi:Mitochondrial carrier protein
MPNSEKIMPFNKNSIWSKCLDSFKESPNAINFTSGMGAGFTTGLLVGPAEATKVWMQTTQPPRNLFNRAVWTNMFRATGPFAIKFSVFCAVEFSVNDRVHMHHGPTKGIVASGLAGAFVLTPADHIMYRRFANGENAYQAFRQLKNIHPRVLWTGFTPMFARESVFMTSVMHLGPLTGAILQQKIEGTQTSLEELNDHWKGVGRFVAGIGTSFFSQPWDYLTRQMQKQVKENPTQRARLITSIRQTPIRHLFRGAVPRMPLASIGGVTVAGFFESFKKSVNPKAANTSLQKTQAGTKPTIEDTLPEIGQSSTPSQGART